MKSVLRFAIPVLLLASGSSATAENAETVELLDGRFSVTMPAGWTLMPGLNDEADLQMGNHRTDAYCLILSEPKGDFAGLVTIAEYGDMTRGALMAWLENSSEDGPEIVTVIGEEAIRYVLYGTVENLRIQYWHVSVDSGDHFHQILFWSPPSRFEENQADFEAVLNSFSVVPAEK